MIKNLIVALLISNTLTSQTIHLQSGLNYSSVNMDYNFLPNSSMGNPYSQKDIFTKPLTGYAVSTGIEFGEVEEHATFLLLLQYSSVGAGIGTDEYSQYAKYDLNLKDKFMVNQISILPLMKYKLIKNEDFNLNIQLGPKLDYTIAISDVSNYNASYLDINGTLRDQTNPLRFGLSAGIGAEYNLTNKFSLCFTTYYHQHISKFSNKDIHTNTYGKYVTSYIDYLQFLLGVSYNLNN
jgi:hypothetical protein